MVIITIILIIRETQAHRLDLPDKTAVRVSSAAIFQIFQIVSSLSVPGDQPIRLSAKGPGRSGYINSHAAFVLVLTPCFSAPANRPLSSCRPLRKHHCFHTQ